MPTNFEHLVRQYAEREAPGDPQFSALAVSILRAESSQANPMQVSPKGAMGPMQVMPGTFQEALPGGDPNRPEHLAEAGVKHLAGLWKQYGRDPTKTAAAYNAGAGAVEKYGGVPPYRETRGYVDKVVGRLKSIRDELARTKVPEVRRILSEEYDRLSREKATLEQKPSVAPPHWSMSRGGLVQAGAPSADPSAELLGDAEFFPVKSIRTFKKTGVNEAYYNGRWHRVEEVKLNAFNGKPVARLGEYAPGVWEIRATGAEEGLGGTTAQLARGGFNLALGESLESGAKLRRTELGLRHPEVVGTPYERGRTATMARGATSMLTDPLSYIGLRGGALGLTATGALQGGLGELGSEMEEGRELSPGRIAIGAGAGGGLAGAMGLAARGARSLMGPGAKELNEADKILRERLRTSPTPPTGGSFRGPDIGQAPENILEKPISLDPTPIKTPAASQKGKQPVEGYIVEPGEGDLDQVLPRTNVPPRRAAHVPGYADLTLTRPQGTVPMSPSLKQERRLGDPKLYADRAAQANAEIERRLEQRRAGRETEPDRRKPEPAVGKLPEPPKPEFPPIRLDEPVGDVREFPPLPSTQIGVEPSGKSRLKGMPAWPKISYENDTLLTAIAKLGGLRNDLKSDLIGANVQRSQAGFLHIFKKQGKDLDSMREALIEQGYIPPEAVAEDGGLTWLREAIRDETNGTNKFYSLRGSEDARYQRMREESGRINIGLATKLATTGAGAALGAGLDPNDRTQGAVLGAAGGLAIGGGLKRFATGGYGSALNAALNPAARTFAESQGRAAAWEREAMKTMTGLQKLEKSVPKDRYPAIINAIESANYRGLSPNEQALAVSLKHATDQIGTVAQQVGLIPELRPNHVPLQFDWEDKATKAWFAAHGIEQSKDFRLGFSDFTPHQLARTIETHAQARSLGLKPKYESPSDIFAGYANSTIHAIEGKRAVQELMKLKDSRGTSLVLQGSRLSALQRRDWKPIRQMRDNKVAELDGFYVHPDVADSVELGLSSWEPNVIARSALATSWALKRMEVSASAFHANNLVQSMMAGYGAKGPVMVADFVAGALGKIPSKISLGKVPAYESSADLALKAWKTNDLNSPLGQAIDRGIRNGLQVGAGPLEEVMGRDAFRKVMDKASKSMGAAGVVPAGVNMADKAFQDFTFSYTWNGIKLSLFSDLYKSEVVRNTKRHAAGKEPLKDLNEIARTVATHVNSLAGGIDWAAAAEQTASKFFRPAAMAGATPKSLAIAKMAFLAPDWNVAAIQPWLRAAGVSTSDADLMRLSQNYAFWSTFYSQVAMNGIQKAKTGTWTWDNDFRPANKKSEKRTPGEALHDMTFIDWGDGTHKQVAKHWAEMPHLAADAPQFLVNKLQPMITEPIEAAVNRKYLSMHGYAPAISEKRDEQGVPKTWLGHAADYAKWFGYNRLPIGVKEFRYGPGEGLLGIAGVQTIGGEKKDERKPLQE